MALFSSPIKHTEEYYKERTPGINVVNLQLEPGRYLRCFDFGGQPEFMAGHSRLVFNEEGLLMLVLSLKDDSREECLLDKATHWLSFFLASGDMPDKTASHRRPALLIVFSHHDQNKRFSTRQLNSLCSDIAARFSGDFTTHPSPFILNCRSQSLEMDKLKEVLSQYHREICQASSQSLTHVFFLLKDS